MTNIKELSFSCVARGPVVHPPSMMITLEKWNEDWSFSVQQVGGYVVLGDVCQDGKKTTECYGCLGNGLNELIRKGLTDLGLPEDQAVILVWPGECQCWDGTQNWCGDPNGLTIRAYLWEKLVSKLPATIMELKEQADDIAMARLNAMFEREQRERSSG
ncbi:MAG: hypothetical protein WD970_02925 [Patescibacteria group bacterium]